jgi:uncharacterized membrane protein
MLKPGYYKHNGGPNKGRYEYWDGSKWAGNGRLFDSKEQALAFMRRSESKSGAHSGVHSGATQYGFGQEGNAQGQMQGQMRGAFPKQGQDFTPQQGQAAQQGANNGKTAKKSKKSWPWVLLGVFLVIALIAGGVVWHLANTPAQEIKGSAKPAPEVSMSVGETKKGEDSEAGSAANGALSKEQLLEKAQKAKDAGNKQQAEYYEALAKNAPEAEKKTEDDTVSANKEAALDIANNIAKGYCGTVKDKYAKHVDGKLFLCDGYDANNGQASVVSDNLSKATNQEEFKLQWGTDQGKQQGVTILFDATGQVVSAMPFKN